MSVEFIEYSLEGLRDESIRLAKLVERDGYRPDCVAYLARGGWIIGETVAEYFGVPVVELSAHRSGDSAKGRLPFLLSKLPRSVRKFLRELEISRRLKHDDGKSQYKTICVTERYPIPEDINRILLVDDSADTGASVIAAVRELSRLFSTSEVRSAVLNVFAGSKAWIDWHLHRDCLLCLPSSKDNAEYSLFVRQYEGTSLQKTT